MGIVPSKVVPLKYPKQIRGRRRNALWAGLAFAVIPLIIIVIIYYNLYIPVTSEEPDPDNSIIDTVDIVATLCIVILAIVYWAIFHQGYISHCLNYPGPETAVWPKFALIYAFGLGLLAPAAKSLSKEGDDYGKNLYGFYPAIFLSMMVGNYLYELGPARFKPIIKTCRK